MSGNTYSLILPELLVFIDLALIIHHPDIRGTVRTDIECITTQLCRLDLDPITQNKKGQETWPSSAKFFVRERQWCSAFLTSLSTLATVVRPAWTPCSFKTDNS